MPAFTTRWSHDLDSGVGDLITTGHLDLPAATRLRSAAAKAIAEQPRCILIDLNGIHSTGTTAAGTTAALILNTLGRRAADAGVDLCCHLRADHPQRATIAAALTGGVALYASRTEALGAADMAAAGLRRLHRQLPRADTAIRPARTLAADACTAWDIEQVSDDAQFIISELTTNVVRHTTADQFDLVLLLRRSLLHIQVIDADPRQLMFPSETPATELSAAADRVGGRGLSLVRAVAARCGVTELSAGKIVWATLRTGPPASAEPDDAAAAGLADSELA